MLKRTTPTPISTAGEVSPVYFGSRGQNDTAAEKYFDDLDRYNQGYAVDLVPFDAGLLEKRLQAVLQRQHQHKHPTLVTDRGASIPWLRVISIHVRHMSIAVHSSRRHRSHEEDFQADVRKSASDDRSSDDTFELSTRVKFVLRNCGYDINLG